MSPSSSRAWRFEGTDAAAKRFNLMAFLLHNPIEPAERRGLILSAQEAMLQRFRPPGPRIPDLRQRPQ